MCLYESLALLQSLQTQVVCRNAVANGRTIISPDDQTIPDVEKFSLTYLPDRVRWFEMTANPSTPNQNVFKKVK